MASLREVIDISKHYNILDAAQAAKAVRKSQAKARTQARKKNTGHGEKYINKATGHEATKDDDYEQKNSVSENKERNKLKKIRKTSKKERKRKARESEFDAKDEGKYDAEGRLIRGGEEDSQGEGSGGKAKKAKKEGKGEKKKKKAKKKE